MKDLGKKKQWIPNLYVKYKTSTFCSESGVTLSATWLILYKIHINFIFATCNRSTHLRLGLLVRNFL